VLSSPELFLKKRGDCSAARRLHNSYSDTLSVTAIPLHSRAFYWRPAHKKRVALVSVVDLTLDQLTPRDFEDVWALIEQWFPHYCVSLYAAPNLDVVRPTHMQCYRYFGNPPGVLTAAADAHQAGITLYFLNHPIVLRSNLNSRSRSSVHTFIRSNALNLNVVFGKVPEPNRLATVLSMR
jgi:hypothetical protein